MGRKGLRRGEVRGAPRAPAAPCGPAAPGTRRGGQLLYWQALRPEAGPCRPP